MTVHDPVRFVAKNMRVDLRLIAEMIAPGTRVLDIGCGDGVLIDQLFRTRGCDARWKRASSFLNTSRRSTFERGRP